MPIETLPTSHSPSTTRFGPTLLVIGALWIQSAFVVGLGLFLLAVFHSGGTGASLNAALDKLVGPGTFLASAFVGGSLSALAATRWNLFGSQGKATFVGASLGGISGTLIPVIGHFAVSVSLAPLLILVFVKSF